MSTRLLVPPSLEPVSLELFKAQARVDTDEEDVLIGMYIAAARRQAESRTRRALITQTWLQTHDEFPPEAIRLQRPDVLAIGSVTYLDADGATQTLASDAYVLDAASTPGWLVPAAGTSWPSAGNYINAVNLTYTCGYGPEASDVPADLCMWIYLLAAQFYQHRTPTDAAGRVTAVPNRFHDQLLDPYIVYDL